MEVEAVAVPDLGPPVGAHLPATDRRVLPALCLATFVGVLTFVAPAPVVAAEARGEGVGVPLLGQVVAAMLLLSALLGLVAGPLADRYGHRRLIVLGLSAAAACLLGFGFAPAFPVLLVAALAGAWATRRCSARRSPSPAPPSRALGPAAPSAGRRPLWPVPRSSACRC